MDEKNDVAYTAMNAYLAAKRVLHEADENVTVAVRTQREAQNAYDESLVALENVLGIQREEY